MKAIGRYILAGLGVSLLYWVWIALFPRFFSGLSEENAFTVGTGFFLAFEMVILTGVIMSKFKNK